MAGTGEIGGVALASIKGRERYGRAIRGCGGARRGIIFYYVVGPTEKVKHVRNTRVKKQI